MSADTNRKNRRQTVKTRSRFTTLLTVYFFVALIIPNCVLANTEPYSVWTVEALILMPLGFYMMWSVALRRSGVMIWLAFPFIFFCAFQIVLLYLFGNSIIATDMFTNLLTTNPGEAGELLGNIYPSVVLVCVIYLPLLWLAAREIGHKRYITRTARMNIGLTGAALFALGLLALWPAYHVSEDRHVLRDEIFPLNVLYNLGLSGSEFRKSFNYEKTSAGFSYEAERTAEVPGREVYVYIIGEASRAMNWQLYGYGRETNPLLSQEEGLVVFRDVLTQSNTTHKSVPLILSSVATDEHDELYRRKGLPALFNEAGFDTWFISNQSRQGAMIDHLAHDAKHLIYIRSPRHDTQLLDEMRKAIEKSTSRKLFFILHCYGSHFSYHQRYPREFAYFQPDNDVAIAKQHRPMLVNAYDNSVRYTDYVLSRIIDYLGSLENTSSALLYCADHGEDLIDDHRERFLHASPTTTAYQLYVASLAWFSESYRERFPEKVAAAEANATAPATTHALFHTMADMASIRGRFLTTKVSLVSPDFDRTAPRRYLNDHNEAVPYRKTGLRPEDMEVFRRYGIELN
ncbi:MULTISPECIES: phosphoethanolamine transferase [Alistipes]|uniref:phosphoethanolamine transferase n=1 Tax=Alistipes TaxID=239759 RepID=UPI0023EFAA08|nr:MULTISPECIES: phosphoethanolamine transferase [Alistipes]MBR2217704.1 lipid A phosphoethanolamine transferase [Alistipes sp.]MCI7307957.1 lipid A phosphoethanolamine transferase [Alistipes senegalensis]MDD7039883.1 sulfatase-like hydrolase/transferase [Alistipes senegalensis]MDY2877089.1 sulfatase-like hydrolase/transferase [Alistipes senegalensis]